MSKAEDAAAAAAATIIAASDAEEAPDESSGSADDENVVEFPSFDVELPADIQALLAEDDADLTITDDELDELSEENEDVPREVLARMRRAEKKAEHYEKLRTADARKGWEAEAKQFLPLSEPFLDQIEATSRRGFIATAKQIHERMQPIVEEKVLKPAREAIAAEKAKAAADAKEEAKKAWGKPVVENEQKSDAVPEAFQRRRGRGEFSDTVRAMLFDKEA